MQTAHSSSGQKTFDFIVVGGGAAGCVVAARLSEDPANRVLLLEAGPHARHPLIKMAGGYFKIHGTSRTFLFKSEPIPGANGRQLSLLQGKTLGGGTAINAMCYNRGQKEDYDAWAAAGCDGWGYDEVLPFFKRAENNSRLAGRYHGTEGPLRVSDGIHRHELSNAFIVAAQQASGAPGLPAAFNHDFNGEKQAGVGFYQTMSHRGERSSSYVAYIQNAEKRSNLTVWTDASVHKILFKGTQAIGVKVRHGDAVQDIFVDKEVVLSAGAFMSPKLLMLSGVGPAEHLKAHGIDVVVDLPGVGQNYQDHVLVPVDADLKSPISLMGQDRGWRAISNGLQWMLFRTGVLTSNIVECGAYFDTDGDGRAEIQLNALAASSCGWGDPIPQVHRFSLAPLSNACKSRGHVKLRSANPDDMPMVYGNYLSAQEDVDNLVKGIRLARKIMAAPALAKYLKEESLPGSSVSNSDEDLEAYVRARVSTALHPTGTCAMGTGANAVVDAQLRVHGLQGLRMADASIMPNIIRGNTAAPTIMIAERAADFIHQESVSVRHKATA
ncbi:GMC family oxidoreductase N-terminal domain-containing protein [Pseudomonas syringae]|uniref:GMC family oxidoreductase n=1 Tax=Pseudomonas syringae TaxID=317 RepID=UPI00215B2299|nr:GMC family oxidoreductase N-terminal domain-containing protein [Pseudomonas syringae]MCR8717708.1 GMC family oxidoreductase N-terminal domain-containing protein [Pseudomonas syringae]